MSVSHSHGEVAITAFGMISALGFDVRNAMAASRAGLSRAADVDDFPIKSTEDGVQGTAIAHAAPISSRGFEGNARLLALGKAGIGDLHRTVDWTQVDTSRIGLFLALPSIDRIYSGLPLVEPEETRESRAEEARVKALEKDPDKVASRLLQKIIAVSGLPVSPEYSRAFLSGHCGVAEAATAAVLAIGRGEVSAAVIGGVDTLIDDATLAWLMSTGRLKCDANPAGLQPGEAGCFALLESREVAHARGVECWGFLRAAVSEQETRPFFSSNQAEGKAVAGVLGRLLEDNPGLREHRLWIVSDQNGEAYRGFDWGNAIVQLDCDQATKDSMAVWFPALSFGDTAAASGMVSMFSALCAFERGYDVSREAIILSAADNVARSAFVVSKAEH